MPNKNYSVSSSECHTDSSLPITRVALKKIKRGELTLDKRLRVIAIGSRVFVTSFQLAGVEGMKVESSEEALNQINALGVAKNVGLLLLSDDVGKEIRTSLTSIRSKRTIPLIFELPSPGSSKENVDYRALLKQILGV